MRFSEPRSLPMTRGMAPPRTRRSGLAATWVAAAAVLVLVLVGLALRGTDEPGPGRVLPGPVTPVGQVDVAAAPGPRTPVAARAPGPALDLTEALEAHWGERWPEVAALLAGDGYLVEPLPELRPWSEVAAAHAEVLNATSDVQRDLLYRRLMAWPGREYDDHPDQVPVGAGSPAEALASSLGLPELADLDELGVARLEERLADTNAELDGVVRAYMEGVAAVVADHVRTGGPERVPLAFPRDEAELEGEAAFFCAATRIGGWASRVRLTASRYPDLAAIEAEIRTLRDRRRDEVRALAGELLAGGA